MPLLSPQLQSEPAAATPPSDICHGMLPAEAAVLQFWTEQGAKLPAAEVQPEQQAEQRRLRSKILQWAAKHPRHRDVVFLQDYMARVRNAAAASGWVDAPWRIPLMEFRALAYNKNPALLLQKVQAAVPGLATHGVRLSHAGSLAVQLRSSPGAAEVARLQLALESLPVSLDCLHVLQIAPTLLNMSNARSVLGRRVAAMQLLHPQLDVRRVLHNRPILLGFTEKALAARWASLQTACGVGGDDIRALVEHQPSVLGLSSELVGWKAQQLQAYESMRELAGARRAPISNWGRVLAAASYRVWRLQYLSRLSAAANIKHSTQQWVRMSEEKFAALNPGYSSWHGSNSIPAEAYRDGHV
jgi:hypothetical protein